MLLSPEGISSLDKAEDGVRVDVVAVGESVFEEDALQSHDMGPGGFLFDQSGIEVGAAIIIEGGDKGPFFLQEPRAGRRRRAGSILPRNGLRPLGHGGFFAVF